jgi:hypothetical protein
VDGTGSEMCPVRDFGINGVEHSVSVIRSQFTNQEGKILFVWYKAKQIFKFPYIVK